MAHVLDDFLRRVERALVLVVFEQVLEDAAEHLGIDADFRILRSILVDSEVEAVEGVEEILEQFVGKLDGGRIATARDRPVGTLVALEKSAIQVRDADPLAGRGRKYGGRQILLPTFVQRFEEQRLQHEIEEIVLELPALLLGVEQIDNVPPVAISPFPLFGNAQPALFLKKLQEYETSKQFLHVITGRLVRIRISEPDKLVADRFSAAESDEFLVMLLVGFKKLVADLLNRKRVLKRLLVRPGHLHSVLEGAIRMFPSHARNRLLDKEREATEATGKWIILRIDVLDETETKIRSVSENEQALPYRTDHRPLVCYPGGQSGTMRHVRRHQDIARKVKLQPTTTTLGQLPARCQPHQKHEHFKSWEISDDVKRLEALIRFWTIEYLAIGIPDMNLVLRQEVTRFVTAERNQ